VYIKPEGINILITVEGDRYLRILDINTVKLKNDTVYGVKVFPSNTRISIPWSTVKTIEVDVPINQNIKFRSKLDDYHSVGRKKELNDSLKSVFDANSKYVVHWVPSNNPNWEGAEVFLIERACFHFVFSDDKEVYYGIVQKITKDSIYVSSTFNNVVASKQKIDYKILKYKISDITTLKLPSNSGFGFKKLRAKNYILKVVPYTPGEMDEIRDQISGCPDFYYMEKQTLKFTYYVNFLTERGFVAIHESGGGIYW
jgi:hypothetical protein